MSRPNVLHLMAAARKFEISWNINSRVADAKEALSRSRALALDRRRNPVEEPDASMGSLAIPGTLKDSAARVAAKARAAALKGKAGRALLLTASLREMPWDNEWREAINVQAGEPSRNLLQVCASKGMGRSIQVLLDMQASLLLKDGNGKTALHLAAEAGHTGVVKQLLRRQTNPDIRDASGQTPLLAAAIAGRIGVCKALAWFGAKVDAADSQGKTPLSVAPPELKKWLETKQGMVDKARARAGSARSFKQLGVELPAHVVAPKLVLTPVGYCPVDDDGKVEERARGVR
eukprot:CAMPEP_0178421632 /NCGR_PEP_ID=MMETSP0689_2-20121128/26746_1 /TAXON_ID=160604 /ORGANISM="Amphidinium massartii, Strain CS-259" /LENGTH=289 /DNA_ID=CAMNT_0020043147 /DNA_START=134 /DNA_END=1001 /DNA_ORIENTATION=+